MIRTAEALRQQLSSGRIAQRLVARQIVITETNERVSLTAIKKAVKAGWAEPVAADLFGEDLSAWRAPDAA